MAEFRLCLRASVCELRIFVSRRVAVIRDSLDLLLQWKFTETCGLLPVATQLSTSPTRVQLPRVHVYCEANGAALQLHHLHHHLAYVVQQQASLLGQGPEAAPARRRRAVTLRVC